MIRIGGIFKSLETFSGSTTQIPIGTKVSTIADFIIPAGPHHLEDRFRKR